MDEPTRNDVDNLEGPAVLEFGATWCGYCHALNDAVEQLKDEHPDLRFIWVEDGPGRPLGRSFRVKLWPTFIFLRDGEEVRRLVRPAEDQLTAAFDAIAVSQ